MSALIVFNAQSTVVLVVWMFHDVASGSYGRRNFVVSKGGAVAAKATTSKQTYSIRSCGQGISEGTDFRVAACFSYPLKKTGGTI